MASAGASGKKTSKSSSRRVAFNQSRVRLFLRCGQAYYFRYDYPIEVMGERRGELVPKYAKLPLKKGGWMHKLLEAHYLKLAGLGNGWEEVHSVMAETFDSMFDEEKELYGDLPNECRSMMRRYLRHYADEEENFKITRLANGEPAVEFTIEVPLREFGLGKHVFKGTIDILVDDLDYGGSWIRDAKWVSSIPSPDERMMAPQNIMYAWALRHLGYDVRGFIYDYGRTKSPTQPYILQNGSVSVAKKIDTDVATYLRAIKKAHGKRWKSFARTVYKEKLLELKARESTWFARERIPVDGPRMKNGFNEYILACKNILARGEPLRNYLYNCKFNCDYHEACVASFQGLDISNLMKSQFHVEKERYGIEEIQ